MEILQCDSSLVTQLSLDNDLVPAVCLFSDLIYYFFFPLRFIFHIDMLIDTHEYFDLMIGP